MIFGGQFDMEMWRYSYREEAELGHLAARELVAGRWPCTSADADADAEGQ